MKTLALLLFTLSQFVFSVPIEQKIVGDLTRCSSAKYGLSLIYVFFENVLMEEKICTTSWKNVPGYLSSGDGKFMAYIKKKGLYTKVDPMCVTPEQNLYKAHGIAFGKCETEAFGKDKNILWQIEPIENDMIKIRKLGFLGASEPYCLTKKNTLVMGDCEAHKLERDSNGEWELKLANVSEGLHVVPLKPEPKQ